MRTLRRFSKRLLSWATIKQDEQRLQAEIEEHLASATLENIRRGLPLTEARRQAILKFGAVQAISEDYRDRKGLPFMETLFADIRHSLRRLRKAPAFTVTAILTLALGIGATTSIFTLVHAVLLKSLPVSNPDDLYRLGRHSRCCLGGGYNQPDEWSIVSYDLYKHFRDNTNGFAELAAFSVDPSYLFGVRRAGASEPAQSYPGEFVSGNYFTMFGIAAYAGRALSRIDDQPNAPPAAVISYRLWQQKYASDPSVIGGVFNLNDTPFTVVGIAPPGFFGDTLRDRPPDFFMPISTEPLLQGANSWLRVPYAHWLNLIGRVQAGVTRTSLEAQMRVELKQWLFSHQSDPEMDSNERANLSRQTLYLSPGGAGITSLREKFQDWLKILMLVSGFVLAIVCANVANLMLVRGMERRQQTSLSVALGARPSRLIRQALTESLVLSLLGAAAGLGVAYAGTRLIVHFAFSTHTGFASVPISASPSIPVLLFAFAVSLITGVAFGVAPAWMAARVDPIEALRGGNRSTSRQGSLPRQTLVAFQAALSLVLLSASGLLMVALRNLENQDFGFDQERRTIVNIDPQLAGYRASQLTALYRRIQDSLSLIPGVSQVALCWYSPQSGDSWNEPMFIDGRPAPAPGGDNISYLDRVTPGYFDSIGNPIVRGRGVSDQDTPMSRHVAVINEAFARKFFPGQDPIGKHFGRNEIRMARQYEIVGIAKDARYLTTDLDKPISPFVFLPEAQQDIYPRMDDTERDVHTHFLHDVVIVTKPGASLSIAEVHRVMAGIDPNLPVNFVSTLRDQVSVVFGQQRLIARLTSLFGILSLVLASIGLYGVTAYNAGRRSNEIRLRIALGATRKNVVALVLRGAFGLIAIGLLLGLPLSAVAGRFLGNQLYGVNPYNPEVIAIAVAALGFSALIASLVPAFRASSVSPVQALRSD
jgi:predicted permease